MYKICIYIYTELEKVLAANFQLQFLTTKISAVLCQICLTWFPNSVSVFVSKWRKYLEMSLICEYLNSVKSENQKFNFGFQVARGTKEVRYWNKKSTSLFLNWNTMLFYITMTITINNSIITNKTMSLRARHTARCVPPLAIITSIHTPPAAQNQPTNTLLCTFNNSLIIQKIERTKGTIY